MNREVEAKLKLTATDASGPAFASMQRRLAEVDKRAEAVARAERRRRREDWRLEESIGAAARANIDQRRRAAAEASARYRAAGRMVATGAVAAGYMGFAAFKSYAELERRMNRIGNTAGATQDQIAKAFVEARDIANKFGVSLDNVLTSLETTVATGRDLPSAMEFLPKIAALAQASNGAWEDMANTLDSVAKNFRITAAEAQKASDIIVEGGNLGKFEGKDMAAYVPSLAPAFTALGYQGIKGEAKMVAMLQVIRESTGSASEAATAFANVIQKLETEETANKFKKFGVDLRQEMAAARKDGEDLIEVFLDLTDKATKGDLSKLPQIFADAEFQKGMRALMQSRDAMHGMTAELMKADGATMRDLGRVIDDNTAKIQRFENAWGRMWTAAGSALADTGISEVMDMASGVIEQAQSRNDAIRAGLSRRGIKSYDEMEAAFGKENIHFDWLRNRWTPTDSIMDQLEHEGRGAGLKGDLPPAGRRHRREANAYHRAAAEADAPAAVPSRVADAFAVLGDIKATVEGPVTAELTGQANITTTIEIAPTNDFIAKVTTAVKNQIPHVAVNGSGGPASGPGSTGKTMADVVPQ